MYLDIFKGLADGVQRRQNLRHGIRILLYHGVVERRNDLLLERNCHTISELRTQIRFLKRSGAVVLSLDELEEQMRNPKRWRRPRVVITFDDGYRNNLTVAELFEAAAMPWALFVTTGLMNSKSTVWTVEIALLLLHGQAEGVDLLGSHWSLRNRDERERSFQSIRVQLKQRNSAELRDDLLALRGQFPDGESERLVDAWPGFQMLNWDEAKSIDSGLGIIGSHGVEHELHHADQNPDTRSFELRESKRELEDQLGHSCCSFAFPNGSTNPDSAAELSQSGYKMAFTTVNECTTADTNRLLIPRIGAPGTMRSFSREYFLAPVAV